LTDGSRACPARRPALRIIEHAEPVPETGAVLSMIWIPEEAVRTLAQITSAFAGLL
jgi:hypothetical protein